MQRENYIGLFIYKIILKIQLPNSTEYTARKLQRKYSYKYSNRVKILTPQYMQLLQI